MTKEINKLQNMAKIAWNNKNFDEFRMLRNRISNMLCDIKRQTYAHVI